MKHMPVTLGVGVILVAASSIAFISTGAGETMQQSSPPVHLSSTFDFEIDAPLAKAALLFGPESEKSWAGERWQPVFLYPQPGKDIAGSVFTVSHWPHNSVWVNTVYDTDHGRMQYVAVIPQVVATVVDVKLAPDGAAKTRVEVTYTRTALDPAANDDVRHLAKQDAVSGPEWSKAINKSLAAAKP